MNLWRALDGQLAILMFISLSHLAWCAAMIIVKVQNFSAISDKMQMDQNGRAGNDFSSSKTPKHLLA